MAHYMFSPSKKANAGRLQQRGMALITAVLVLLGLALLGLGLSGQQVLAHYQQISLDEQRLHRQLATETLFDEVAHALGLQGHMEQSRRGDLARPFAQGGPGQRVLYSEAEDVPCPHKYPTLSTCWRIKVRQSGSGFIRERMLVMPQTSCAAAYWFPPEGRVVSAPALPPADTLPIDDDEPKPVVPPLRPRPGGGLRP